MSHLHQSPLLLHQAVESEEIDVVLADLRHAVYGRARLEPEGEELVEEGSSLGLAAQLTLTLQHVARRFLLQAHLGHS